jgi:hypothetical protein
VPNRIVIALLIAVGVRAHNEEEPFAEILQRIIRASRENFRPLQGARIEIHPGNLSYYQPKVNLPGTTECRIDEHPLAYSCNWRGTRCEKLLAETAKALGAEWSRRGSTFKNTGRFRWTEVAVTPGCAIAVSVLRQYSSNSP